MSGNCLLLPIFTISTITNYRWVLEIQGKKPTRIKTPTYHMNTTHRSQSLLAVVPGLLVCQNATGRVMSDYDLMKELGL